MVERKEKSEGSVLAHARGPQRADNWHGDTYFASSVRGSGDIFIYPDIEIPNEVLEKCGKAHRNGGNCAEVIIIASWYRAKASLTKKLKGESKSIVTIGVDSDDVIDPCC